MKTYRHFHATKLALIASSIIVFRGYSADGEKVLALRANIPKSIFVVPKDDKEGRDPFFPTSVRFSNKETPVKVAAPVKISLVLNGLSGTPGHRLAMINGRTMAEGETSDVPSGGSVGSLVKVHCVEIKENSVVVEAGGARQELMMRGDK